MNRGGDELTKLPRTGGNRQVLATGSKGREARWTIGGSRSAGEAPRHGSTVVNRCQQAGAGSYPSIGIRTERGGPRRSSKKQPQRHGPTAHGFRELARFLAVNAFTT